MIVTIGICTFKRPRMLAETLKSIASLKLPNNFIYNLIVVDNDENFSSKDCFKNYKFSNLNTTYQIAHVRGIAYARNKVLQLANHFNTDLLCFIDDDEIVDKNWMESYLESYKNYKADVICGPALPIYPKNTPNWIKKGKFFETSNKMEGKYLNCSATNNVIFDFKKLFGEYGLRFNESLKSREDNDFFMRAHIKGAKIRHTNKAIVYESIPLSRMNLNWLLKRVYKSGEAYSKRELIRSGKIAGTTLIISKIIYRIIRGLITMPLAILKGYCYFVKSIQQFSIVTGMIGGLLGSNYDDYKIIHGS